MNRAKPTRLPTTRVKALKWLHGATHGRKMPGLLVALRGAKRRVRCHAPFTDATIGSIPLGNLGGTMTQQQSFDVFAIGGDGGRAMTLSIRRIKSP